MTDQTPSRRAGLRSELAAALEAADYSGNMRRGDLADAILPVLYREWPWLRAEAEELEQARAELLQHAEAESAAAAAGSYANGSEHAIAHPQPWLHIDLTSPDPTTANTSALAIADHLAAEFDGVGMRISSNAVEGGEGQQDVLTPGEPDFTGPLTGIEVRDPCPFCESSPSLIPRQLMAGHVATVHPEVQTLDTTAEQRARTTVNNPPGLREQLHAAIESEIYEYRERTMFWEECGGVTQEIARLATRGAMEVLDGRP